MSRTSDPPADPPAPPPAPESSWLFDGLAAAVLLVACLHGVGATGDLHWPYDTDLHRDIGQAHSIARGAIFEDPQFRSEGQWYNPLVPSLVAAAHWLTGLEIPLLYARLGAYLNLLGPICLYVAMARMIGRSAALHALVVFVFVSGAEQRVPYAPTYSPWLYASYFSLAPFFVGVATLAIALRRGGLGWHLAAGAWIGLTFLGHTFPALLLGALTLAAGCSRALSAEGPGAARSALGRALAALAVAFAVSLPFSHTLLLRYGLQIQNPAPTAWVYDEMLELLPYLATQLSAWLPVAAFGLLGLVRTRSPEARLLLGLIALVAAWVGFVSMRDELLGLGVSLPPAAFSMHAHLYLGTGLCLLFGVGTAEILRIVSLRLPPGWTGARAARAALAVLPAAAILAVSLPGYAQRSFFTEARQASLKRARIVEQLGAARWLQTHGSPDDVLLADDQESLYTGVGTGRKIVASYAMHSNPYVDVVARRRDRDAMLRLLRRGEWAGFAALAERYGVTYVLLRRPLRDPSAGSGDRLRRIVRTRHGALYRVH